MAHIPKSPTVSVVLCTYSPQMYEHFREAADSILSQSFESVELVIVVDGSEELYERSKSDFGTYEETIVHANETNRGLLESRNIGVDLATGDAVAFIDDDAVADEHWIEELVSTYHQHDAVAVGGKMVADWVAGRPRFLPEEFYWLIGVTHRGFPEEPVEVRNTFGSNISFARDVFQDLGGFDHEIGGRKGEKNLQGGETELCARLRETFGQGIYYNPKAIVAHKVFDYRTRFWWLIDRAFWQGYSKRRMEHLISEGGAEESQFLSQLLTEFIPGRLGRFVRGPSTTEAGQLLALFVLTGAVGFGYLYAVLRSRV